MTYTFIGGADGPTAVFLAGKVGTSFGVIAICALLIFYGIYIGKMFAQKKKGIRTDQMARGKEKNKTFYIELFLKIGSFATAIAAWVSVIFGTTMFTDELRYAGAVLAFCGDIAFGLAVWTMRDSWRAGIPTEDKTEFVHTGIYKWSRNPAFLGFDLLYVGVALMFGNIVLLLVSVFTMVLFHLQILQEEQFLAIAFGEEYLEYKKHTGRYFGYRK